jgi:ParB family chromosome partitioning protein
MRQGGLGRGLEALIPVRQQGERIHNIRIDRIDPNPYQPRQSFDEGKLQELADSIKEKGVVQPIIVTQNGERYRLIAGERRLLAASRAGLQEIPSIIKNVTDDGLFELSLIENIQRENLSPLEEAMAYRGLIQKFGYTQDELASKLGKNRATVANTLRLLDLPSEVQEFIAGGKITAGHARAILSVRSRVQQLLLTQKITSQNLTVREAEEMARRLEQRHRANKKRQLAPEYEQVVSELREALGTKVEVSQGRKEAGVLKLYYRTLEQLEDIVRRLTEG